MTTSTPRLVRAVAVCAVAGLATLSSTAMATGAPTAPTGPGSRQQAFAAAAGEFGVPTSLLEAVSYAQTRWEGHAGQHNTDGGYGPMNLVDGTLFADGGGKDGGAIAVPQSVDTLGRAAALLGVDRDALRQDPAANIRGGAALLASEQKALNLPTGTASDLGRWYAAVAAQSGAADETGATQFADDTYASLASGATVTTSDGQTVAMAGQVTNPARGQVSALGLKKGQQDPSLECPASIDCEWVKAPYEQWTDAKGAVHYGNYDIASRDTSAGPAVQYIVIHDTEASWKTTLQLVQDRTYLAWHYSVRSSDGLVAQHVPTKDVAPQAGNWYVNMHSIGVEHEGFAAQGATWYSEPLYRSSAKLVRYLAEKYDVPLDRGHIIGHDQVPGITPGYIPGMHWDPGPYWDWQHYFQLMGAPLQAHRTASSDVVRILPGFEDNVQVVTGCTTKGTPCEPQGTNFVYLHTAPSASAPLVKDIGLHTDGSASTTEVADTGARAAAGVEYAVADQSGDWTAIWWLGQKAWFENPKSSNAIPVKGSVVVPRAGLASAPTYGRAYPEAGAYAAYPGVPVQSVVPLPYSIMAGQKAALQDATIVTDYYRATTFAGEPTDVPAEHVDIRGQDVYYQVSFGHRSMFVRAADVDILPATP